MAVRSTTSTRMKTKRSLASPKLIHQQPLVALEQLDETQLAKIHDRFKKNNDEIMAADLRKMLLQIGNIKLTDEDYDMLFRMFNKTGLGFTTWDEFISFILVLYDHKNIAPEYKSLLQPIPNETKLLKSNHRHPINRIAFFPTIKPDRTVNIENGSIITCSKDGTINFWSLFMQLERTAQSTCPELKVQSTWVTDLVVLPDMNIICTSSTERDLRFYDTSARKFELRVMFTSLRYAVTTMHYKFYQNVNERSKLIVGDMGGNIMLIYIVAVTRGPFKSKPGDPLLNSRFESVIKGHVPGFQVILYKNCHTDFVRKIVYYEPLHGFLSCAQCPKAAMRMTSEASSGLVEDKHVFKVNTGIWCFDIVESLHMIATGGPDCLIRIWNPFVPARPVSVFYGHHKGVLQLTFQDEGKLLYSLDNSRWIKVWDINGQQCIQTFMDLPSIGEHASLTTYYNEGRRCWIVGSLLLALVPLSPLQNAKLTDGTTHAHTVTVIMYNPLFKMIVTCCTGSYILVWNPWDGRRMLVIKDAHTKDVFGEKIPVAITCGALDPAYLRILTAAADGTIKTWNILTGTNLRNIQVSTCNEIKSVIWLHERIFVCGWNRCIAEFADTTVKILPKNAKYAKEWDILHDDDISASAAKIPETIVTGSYAGELVFWRLETGQAYKKFFVYNPMDRIKIQFKTRKKNRSTDAEEMRSLISMKKKKDRSNPSVFKNTTTIRRTLYEKEKEKEEDKDIFHFKPVSVVFLLFLQTRKTDPDVGSLLVALNNGIIQLWSHATAGGFIVAFDIAHKIGDYALCMTTDKNNEYLILGTCAGYIKIYLMIDFGYPDPEKISLPKYRLKFPFMWGDKFLTGARIQGRKQRKPTLLNCFRGHSMPVTCIEYIHEAEIIISGSVDYSARMWTISGRFLQTLGTFKKWKPLKCHPVDDNFEFTVPADLVRTLSSTSLRVFKGGIIERRLTYRQLEITSKKKKLFIDHSKIYGNSIDEPYLGNYYKVINRENKDAVIEFDTSFPHIPVYNHLIMPKMVPIEDPTKIIDSEAQPAPDDEVDYGI